MVPCRILFAVLLAGLSGACPGAQGSPTTPPNLAAGAPVLAVFERSCAECHDAARRAKPKGHFGHILDLEKLAHDGKHVIPGDPQRSELYNVLIDPDPEARMPPPRSDVPRLTPEDIGLVRQWILSLAVLDPPAASPVSRDAERLEPGSDLSPPVPLPQSAKAVTPKILVARIHPLLVHFPIALLVFAAGIEWLGLLLGRANIWQPAVRWAVAIAALSSPVAAATGWLLAGVEGYSAHAVFLHRWLGVSTAGVAVLSWLLLVAAERTGNSRLRWAARLVLTAAAVLVAITAHAGGQLVYGAGYPFH